MFAALIFIPTLLLSVVLFLGAYFRFFPFNSIWMSVIPFAAAIGVFIIRDGLNEWWYSRHPPGLSDKERDILARYFPYYRQLGVRLKREFENRVSIFRMQKQFQMRLLEKIPGDLQLLVAATGVQVTLGIEGERELLDNLGMVVLFPKEFITPDINDQLHHVEVNSDVHDCLLLSIDFFAKGIQQSEFYYNSGLHGMAKVYKYKYGHRDEDIPCEDQKELLVKLHHLRDFKIGYQFLYTGLPKMELFEMCSEHFFQIPARMKEHLPEVYNYFMNVYHQDPANVKNPVIQHVNAHELPSSDSNIEAA